MFDAARFVSLSDLEEAAADALPPDRWAFLAGGAMDGRAVAANRAAFSRWTLRPRVVVDVSRIDLAVEWLGRRRATPFFVAPMAFHRVFHVDGESGTARAAAEEGALFVASTTASETLETTAAASEAPRWFQLYVHRDRKLTESLVRRAQDAGYEALVLTVDAPVLGSRDAARRAGWQVPPEVKMANVPEATGGIADRASYAARAFDAALTWKDVAWLVRISEMPVVVKGVLDPRDAKLAVEAGAAGVIVSNHGGRQLDAAPAALDALAPIADALEGTGALVLMDGGVRRGTDVVTAFALGAHGVGIGRPVLCGLALGGESGARRALEILRVETENVLALVGRPSVSALGRDAVQETHK